MKEIKDTKMEGDTMFTEWKDYITKLYQIYRFDAIHIRIPRTLFREIETNNLFFSL
jgi:hypothetical protein